LSTISELLADWIKNLKYRDIPLELVQAAKEDILDMFGCGLFGSRCSWVLPVVELVKNWGGTEEASIWGHKEKVPCVNAVFANASSVNAFEFDDSYVPTGIHPGALVVTSVLASAERLGELTGQDMITAVVIGHEISARVRSGLGWSVLHGWNGTAICSTFGAAAATAKVLGLGTDEVVNALGICGPYVGGLLTYGYKAMAKRIVNARSAQGGLMAAFLAEQGFTGFRDIFESNQGGFCKTHSSDPTIDQITRNLGTEYLMRNLVLKKYPNCTSFHAVADAISGLLSANSVEAPNIESVVISTTSGALKNNVSKTYDNISSAQMSMEYAAAAFLLDGKLGIDQYSEERIKSLDIRKMLEKVRIVIDPHLDAMGLDHRMAAKVDVCLKDGTRIESGLVSRPRAMSSIELDKKFMSLSTKAISYEKAIELKNAVLSLQKCSNVTSFAALLGSS
jgi:aconitate decarboxylase